MLDEKTEILEPKNIKAEVPQEKVSPLAKIKTSISKINFKNKIKIPPLKFEFKLDKILPIAIYFLVTVSSYFLLEPIFLGAPKAPPKEILARVQALTHANENIYNLFSRPNQRNLSQVRTSISKLDTLIKQDFRPEVIRGWQVLRGKWFKKLKSLGGGGNLPPRNLWA